MADTFTNRVKRGMKLLDEVRPGWVEKIRPRSLDLSHPSHCVWGQVEGIPFHDVRFLDEGPIPHSRFDTDDMVRLGFMPHGNATRLTAAWRKAIKARRGVAK